MAATEWPTNAAMIADCARLGYLKDTDFILDPTWGRGGWWRVWLPERNALGLDRSFDPDWDFRKMDRFADETFDAVAFDPPYVCVGGRATSGIQGMHDAYGMGDTPLTPALVQQDIDLGLLESFRVVKKGGIVLCKCQSYISSGKLWPGLFFTYESAVKIGFQVVDHLVHIAGPRPQPERVGQQHARRNHSDLLVLRRPSRGQHRVPWEDRPQPNRYNGTPKR
jgi:hypothetical protein